MRKLFLKNAVPRTNYTQLHQLDSGAARKNIGGKGAKMTSHKMTTYYQWRN